MPARRRWDKVLKDGNFELSSVYLSPGRRHDILETLEKVAEGKGLVWEEKLEQLKKNGQWHVEVY